MATYLHEMRRDAAQQADAGSNDKLRAGDTLVVSNVGALGESYAEISRALRDLMRRRLVVQFVEEGLTFDAGAVEGGVQASRDSMIALVAGAAEASKMAARRDPKIQRSSNELAPAVFSDRERGSGALQLRVIGAQLAALGSAVYLFTFWAPDFRRPSPAQPSRSEVAQTAVEAPVETPRYSDREFLVEKEAVSSEKQSPVSEPGRLAGTENGTTNGAVPAFGLSREQQLEIFATVGDWRSARVKGEEFPITLGAAVPADVRLAIFPRRLAARQPLLGKFRFIIAGERIAVVDPGPARIVAVLDRLASR